MGVKIGAYNYPLDIMETLKMNEAICKDFRKFCRDTNIIKGRLMEEFYKNIIVRHNDGSLKANNGYLTMKIIKKDFFKRNQSSNPLNDTSP